MADITSSNSVLNIGVAGLFPTPVQLQGFAQDDAYSMAAVETSENVIGVDGIKSSGFLPTLKTLEITLQADSPSIPFFESWFAAQESSQSQLPAFGTLFQPSVNLSYTLTNGTLRDYTPLAGAKKILQPRKFSIVFQGATGAPA